MATALKKQLAVFRNISVDSRRSRSLLYDSTTANNQTADSLLRDALSGFCELCALDAKLSAFELRLFARSALTFDREQLTQSANADLDATLSEFLLRLSPYFLLRETQLVLEFLVRRYGIHHYNVSSVMQMMLPFHESAQFAAFLSILTLGHSQWVCLAAHREKKVPVNRQFLADQCLRDRSLLSFVAGLAPAYHGLALDQHHPVLYSFLSSVLVAIVPRAEPSVIMEILLPALHDQDSPQFQLAVYPVVSQLALHHSLAAPYQKAVLRSLARHAHPAHAATVLACAVLFVHAQRLRQIPDSVLDYFQKLPDCLLHARQLKDRYFPRFDGSPATQFLSDLSARAGAPLYRMPLRAFSELPDASPLLCALDRAAESLSGDEAFRQVAHRLLLDLTEATANGAAQEKVYERLPPFLPLLSYLLDTLSPFRLNTIHLPLLRLLPQEQLRALPEKCDIPTFLQLLGRAARENGAFKSLLFRVATTKHVLWVLLGILRSTPAVFSPAEALSLVQMAFKELSLPANASLSRSEPFPEPVDPLSPQSVEECLCIILDSLKKVLGRQAVVGRGAPATPFDIKAFMSLLAYPAPLFSEVEPLIWGFLQSDATPFRTLSWQILQKSTITQPQLHVRALSVLGHAFKGLGAGGLGSAAFYLFPTVLLALSNSHKIVRESALLVADMLLSESFTKPMASPLKKPNAATSASLFDLVPPQCKDIVGALPSAALVSSISAFLVRVQDSRKEIIQIPQFVYGQLLSSMDSAVQGFLFESLLSTDQSFFPAADIQMNLLKCSSLWTLISGLPLPESQSAAFLGRLRTLSEEALTVNPTQFHSWIYKEFLARVQSFFPGDALAFELLLLCLRAPSVVPMAYKYSLLSHSLPRITPEFYASLPQAQRSRLFHQLVTLMKNGEQTAQIQEIVENLSLDLDMIQQDWKGFVETFDLSMVQMVSVYSEMVRYHPQVHEHFPLLYPIFMYFEHLLECDLQDTAVLFGLQSILESILSFASQLMQSSAPGGASPSKKRRRSSRTQNSATAFDLKSLIRGLETINFPQPRNTILLILGSLVRAGNREISVDLIEILKSLLPKLLGKESDVYYLMILQLVQMTSAAVAADNLTLLFLQLFIDSFPLILESKKLWFYKSLVVAFGEGSTLHWLVLLLTATQSCVETTLFCQSLFNQFSVSVQLGSISHLLDSLYTIFSKKTLPPELPALGTVLSSVEFVSSQLVFASEQLNSDQFIRTIVSEDNRKLQPAFLKICEIVFLFLHECSAALSSSAAPVDPEFAASTMSSWERCLESCYDVLDTVKEFLDIPTFIVILNILLTHENNSVRKRALIFFNSKIESEKNTLPKNEKMLLLDMLPSLLSMAADASNLLNQQTAILSIHVLADHLASLFQEKFVPVFDSVLSLLSQPLGLESRSVPLVGSVFLLLATLARSLGVLVFPALPNFVPVLIKTLNSFLESCSAPTAAPISSESHILLCQSIFSSFATLLPLFPSFLEPYYDQILTVSLNPIFVSSPQKSLSDTNKHVLSLFATTVPIRSLLPCVQRASQSVSHPLSQISLLRMLGDSLPLLSREGVLYFHQDVFLFLFNQMDYRTRCSSSGGEVSADRMVPEVEDAVVQTFMELVLKLSEVQLKPLFLQVSEWAKEEDHFSDSRLAIFLQLVQSLTTRLRGIFVPYFGFFLDPLLKLFSDYRQRIRQLEYYSQVTLALKCLYFCALYDGDGFVSDSVFHSVRKPLLECLEATKTFDGDKGYLRLVSECLSPCVIQWVRAVNHDEAWKPLHHELLLKTRSSKPLVKLSAVRLVTECFRKMGEEYLPLLPETIPYLAELLGEGDAEIEQASNDLKQCLENLSGENINELLVR